MSIPVQNLYYLLTYAWDRRLNEATLQEVDAAACPNLNTLFARVLANGLRNIVRRGLDRDYVRQEETTSPLRGQIDFAASAVRQTWREGRMHCAFDELTHDVPHNRILKASLLVMLWDLTIDKDSRGELARLLPAFAEVTSVRLDQPCFQRVQLHRSNRIYRFLLDLCTLIHRSYLPDPSHPGRRRFRDILSDEKTMAAVFEKFVHHFAARHLQESGATVSGMQIRWNAVSASAATEDLLPRMKTDVTIAWPHRRLILDCKYYRDALHGRFGRRFISGHLYQLHAYLTNQAIHSGWEDVGGMLLYPTNGYHLNEKLTFHDRHSVLIATLNLDQPWESIHRDLLALLLKTPEKTMG